MKQIKKIQKYQLDAGENKIDVGYIDFFYDQQQRLTQKKVHDHSDFEYPKIITILYNEDGNEIARKTDTMHINDGFSLSWELFTYNENKMIIKEEGCLNNDDEKYENSYLYDENNNLLEEVWIKGACKIRTKYKINGDLYEGISDDNRIKTLKNKKMENILTEAYDNENNLLYRDLYEDFDINDNPRKRTTFRAKQGTTLTEYHTRDIHGNLTEKNVYISIGEINNMLISTEIREIEYYE